MKYVLVGLFLVGLVGCAAPGGALVASPAYQVVGGLISENKHSLKDGGICTPKQAAQKLCWEDWGDVENARGKPTRAERYLSKDMTGKRTEVLVWYFDSEKQTEVFVFDENRRLRDDFVTSVSKFSLKQDRHDYWL